MLADSSARCPFVHTPPQCVCFFGHEGAGSDPKVSVSAHVAIVRVRKRTRGFRFSLRFVRFCTRSLLACAKTDTEVLILPLICPFLHTQSARVCFIGHGGADLASDLSVSAHAATMCVQKRTRKCRFLRDVSVFARVARPRARKRTRQHIWCEMWGLVPVTTACHYSSKQWPTPPRRRLPQR